MVPHPVTPQERQILRDLAQKQASYAALPVMADRTKAWYLHNDLDGDCPLVQVETWTFENDILPPLRCHSPAARAIELQIQRAILNHECIDDDRVVSATFDVEWQRTFRLIGLEKETVHATDSAGRDLAYQHKHPITDLAADLPRLGSTVRGIDREGTLGWKAFVEELIGDLLTVRLANGSPAVCLTQDLVHFMGMQPMFLALMDQPDEFHAIMDRLSTDHLDWLVWQQDQGLWFANNGNDWLNQGSSAFTHSLPRPGTHQVELADLWGFMDSQETVGISPDMFGEFIFPYYRRIADRFGLLSYGCCEPVHPIWKDYLSTLPNLRKVSISPWCDEAFMGEALRNTRTIFHRKPSPMTINTDGPLDEDVFADHIRTTLTHARGCHLEFSFRDIYSLGGYPGKARRMVEIVRREIDRS